MESSLNGHFLSEKTQLLSQHMLNHNGHPRVPNLLPEETQVIPSYHHGKPLQRLSMFDNNDPDSLDIQIPTSDDYENVTTHSVHSESLQHQASLPDQNMPNASDEQLVYHEKGNLAQRSTTKDTQAIQKYSNNYEEEHYEANETTTNQLFMNLTGMDETPFKKPNTKTILAAGSSDKTKKGIFEFSQSNNESSPWLNHVKDPFSSESPLKKGLGISPHKRKENIYDYDKTQLDRTKNPHEIFSRLRNEQEGDVMFSPSDLETQNVNLELDTQKLDLSPFKFKFNDITQRVSLPAIDTQPSFLKFGTDPTQKVPSQAVTEGSNLATQRIMASDSQKSTQLIGHNNINVTDNVDTQRVGSQPNNFIEQSSQPFEGLASLKKKIFISQSSESNDEDEADLQIPGTIDATNQDIKLENHPDHEKKSKEARASQPAMQGVASGSQTSSDKVRNLRPAVKNIQAGRIPDYDQIQNNTVHVAATDEATQVILPLTKSQSVHGFNTLLGSSTPIKKRNANSQPRDSHVELNELAKNRVDLKPSQSPVIQESSPAIRDHSDVFVLDSPTRKSFEKSLSLEKKNSQKSQNSEEVVSSPLKNTYEKDDSYKSGGALVKNEIIKAPESRVAPEDSKASPEAPKPRSLELIDGEYLTQERARQTANTLQIDEVASSIEDDNLQVKSSKKRLLGHNTSLRSNKKIVLSDDEKPENNHGDDADEEESSLRFKQRTIIRHPEDSNFIGSGSDVDMVSEDVSRNNPLDREHNGKSNLSRAELSNTSLDTEVRKPAVWAIYDFKYYPAVILNEINNQYDVQFFDTNALLNRFDILSVLDLRIGDVVKLHFKKETYIVTGLRKSSQSEPDITCIRGYNSVYLKRYIRNSISEKYPEISVSLWDIYMTEASWQKRKKTRLNGTKTIDKPVEHSSVNLRDADTHAQNTAFVSSAATNGGRLKLKTKHLTNNLSRDDQFFSLVSSPDVSPVKPKVKSTIFQNAAFCLTGEREEERIRLTNMIIENGGIVLKEGFETLLSINRNTDEVITDIGILNQFKTVKFAAVIAKNYSRSQKYLQGLALGWPVLSLNFIADCVKNSQWVENWSSYVLAAGESKILGSVQSFDISKFRENYVSEHHLGLANQLKNNSHVLKNYVVLMASKRPSVCEFFFHVLGVKEIWEVRYNQELVPLVSNLRDKYKVKPIRFLFYDNVNVEQIYEKLLNFLAPNLPRDDSALISVKQSTRKRARTEQGTVSTRSKSGGVFNRRAGTALRKRKTRTQMESGIKLELVDWEWVVQCIISSNCWSTNKHFYIEQ